MKLRKMGHTLENWSHLEKRVTLIKMGHSGGKWVTLRNMGHTLKNASHFEKWVTLKNMIPLGKIMGHTFKKRSHLKKWVTLWKNGFQLKNRFALGKMGHTLKIASNFENGSHLKSMIPLGKMGLTYNNGSHFQKGVALEKNVSHFGIWVTFIKICHTGKNGSHGLEKSVTFKKYFTLGKMGQFFKSSKY